MTAAEITGFVVLTLVGVGLSALYSGIETGLYTLNPNTAAGAAAAHGAAWE